MFVYKIGIYVANLVLQVLALFNHKIKLGVQGRKNTFALLKQSLLPTDKTFWFHCASLGEYEQGLPVFEKLKTLYPTHKIILSFFSPSGYEVRKNTDLADAVVYLPIDTSNNAKNFMEVVNPELVIFVKYEIWPNLLTEIKKRKIRALLISALFREDQSYFKWYGGIMKNALFNFEHIFTQNIKSKELLNTIGYDKVTISGDTRFDRVSNQLILNNKLKFIDEFVGKNLCLIFGSTWPEDDKLFIDFINTSNIDNIKYLIAPHNIKPSYINSLKYQIKLKTTCFTEMTGLNTNQSEVFILDTIGLLSKAYQYADIAYVGGGAGNTGLHNILEPAVFGIPILIGKNYENFPEAVSLVAKKGVISIHSSLEFNTHVKKLVNDQDERLSKGQINKEFIEKNKGAVDQILDYIVNLS